MRIVHTHEFNMIMPRLNCAFAVLFGCVFAFLTNAQTADVSAYKQAKQEFAQAEQSAIQKQQSTESVQHRLDTLTEQRDLWQREIVNAKAKVSFAKEKLAQASTAGVREDVEKWRLEASNWDARAKAAIVEEE